MSICALWRNVLVRYQRSPRCIQRKTYATINMDDDGDPIPEGMKTKVTVLNKEDDGVLLIDAFSSIGFRLNNGLRLMGPSVIFPRSVLHWNIRDVRSINKDSLSLFTMLAPKLEILVLGIGESENVSKVDSSIVPYLRSHKLNIEILPTQQALATFNFLNSEKRYIAGAFLPPNFVEIDSSEEFRTSDPFKVDGDFFYHDPNSLDSVKVREQVPKVLKEQRKSLVEEFHGKFQRPKQEEQDEKPRSDNN